MMIVVAVMMLIVSCGEDPFFHAVSIKYEDKVVKTEIVYDGDEYTLPKEVDGIPEIGGWTIDGKEYDVGDKITVTGDITITAVIGTPVVITLYDDVTTTVYVKKGETELTLPKTPERAGYDFDGWDVDGTTVKAEGKVTYKEGMEIKAIWTRYYTITYNVNGGTGSVEAGKLREDSIEEGVKIAAGTGLTKDSLSFSGWNTQSDGSGTAYAVGDVYKTKADLTLYAVWVSEVTVTYRYGDKSYTVTKKPSEVAAWDGTLSDGTKWTKDGNVLDGWYSEEDGKGTYYSSTSSIPNGATLYPHWVDENLSFENVWQKTTYRANAKSDKVATVTSVTIPAVYHGEKVTQIGDFYNCKELKSVAFEKAENIDSLYSSTFPFDGCEKLESIDLSGTKITVIEDQTFNNCSNLASVKLPSTLTKIDDYAFYKCKKLTQIDLPESLTTIGYKAFAESGLTSITIPKNVTTLGYTNNNGYVFDVCTDLKTVVIEGSIKTIETGIFAGCTSLKSVTLPKSLETIGYAAFWKCTGLSSINIPKSVTSIDSYAFDECSNLKTFNMGMTEAEATTAGFASNKPWGAANDATVNWDVTFYNIGDTGPAGGIVFYDAGSTQTVTYTVNNVSYTYTWRYLEAAPENLSACYWGSTDGISGTSKEIGTGKGNTAVIMSKTSETSKHDAAKACDDYVYPKTGDKQFDDWFLPSEEELEALCNNIYKNSKISNEVREQLNSTFWTSSQYSSLGVWFGTFSTAYFSYMVGTVASYSVRPIRSFV